MCYAMVVVIPISKVDHVHEKDPRLWTRVSRNTVAKIRCAMAVAKIHRRGLVFGISCFAHAAPSGKGESML